MNKWQRQKYIVGLQRAITRLRSRRPFGWRSLVAVHKGKIEELKKGAGI